MEYDDVNNSSHHFFLLCFDKKCDPLSLRNVAYGVYTNYTQTCLSRAITYL